MAEVQFYLANIGLVGLLLYTLIVYDASGASVALTALFGFMEAVAIFLFISNMLAAIMPKTEMPH